MVKKELVKNTMFNPDEVEKHDRKKQLKNVVPIQSNTVERTVDHCRKNGCQ
jgi:hypothetical protein